jgi:hypothetical protein
VAFTAKRFYDRPRPYQRFQMEYMGGGKGAGSRSALTSVVLHYVLVTGLRPIPLDVDDAMDGGGYLCVGLLRTQGGCTAHKQGRQYGAPNPNRQSWSESSARPKAHTG